MTIRSDKFDDIYFSPENGLAETEYVFLEQNGLPEAWADKSHFVIGETGFGTGLNFLATWERFERTASKGQKLYYVSFEKYPLPWEQMKEALEPWGAQFAGKLETLKTHYPIRIPGFHRLPVSQKVTLLLVFDDVNGALPRLDVPGGVDAWYLDGFAPAKNPGMWTETVFKNMARLSRQGTSFSTFTAAGAIRRGLQAAGFDVKKARGFGKKRDMLCGLYAERGEGGYEESGYEESGYKTEKPETVERVAVIGGGLAGTASAYVLKQRGLEPVIFDKAKTLAAGASGNDIGLINPRLSKLRTPQADFYMTAWALAIRTLSRIQSGRNINLLSCGSLHLITDDKKDDRYRGTVKNWDWPDNAMRWLDKAEAAEAAGLDDLDYEALYLPDAACVSPADLCEAYAAECEVRLSTLIQTIEAQENGWRVNGETFDAVILACGLKVRDFKGQGWLPLHHVRGQISQIETTDCLSSLSAALCYGGYCSPALQGAHYIGATFQPWLEDPLPRPEDDIDNLGKLMEVVPLPGRPEIIGHRASFRTSSKDRFPVVGPAPDIEEWEKGVESDIPGLYISSGHGSHGIISSLAGAHLIADYMVSPLQTVPKHVQKHLLPSRFLQRLRRKGRL